MRICPVCEYPLIKVEHIEYDGVTENGSDESYFECVNGCDLENLEEKK